MQDTVKMGTRPPHILMGSLKEPLYAKPSILPPKPEETYYENPIDGYNKSLSYTFDENGNQVTQTTDGYSTVTKKDGVSTTTTTPGGYEISYDPANKTCIIKDTKTGDLSYIYGDPHVAESDGGTWDWTSNTSTYVLEDGTKITLTSDGTDASNGFGVLNGINIYSGTGETHIGMNENGSYAAGDCKIHDAMTADGDVYFGNSTATDWIRNGQEVGA